MCGLEMGWLGVTWMKGSLQSIATWWKRVHLAPVSRFSAPRPTVGSYATIMHSTPLTTPMPPTKGFPRALPLMSWPVCTEKRKACVCVSAVLDVWRHRRVATYNPPPSQPASQLSARPGARARAACDVEPRRIRRACGLRAQYRTHERADFEKRRVLVEQHLEPLPAQHLAAL